MNQQTERYPKSHIPLVPFLNLYRNSHSPQTGVSLINVPTPSRRLMYPLYRNICQNKLEWVKYISFFHNSSGINVSLLISKWNMIKEYLREWMTVCISINFNIFGIHANIFFVLAYLFNYFNISDDIINVFFCLLFQFQFRLWPTM